MKPWVMDDPLPIPSAKLGVYYQIVGKDSVQIYIDKQSGQLTASELKAKLEEAYQRTRKLKEKDIYDKLTVTVFGDNYFCSLASIRITHDHS